MATKVTVTMLPIEYATMRAILRFFAGKLTKEHLEIILKDLSYPMTNISLDEQVKYICESLGNTLAVSS